MTDEELAMELYSRCSEAIDIAKPMFGEKEKYLTETSKAMRGKAKDIGTLCCLVVLADEVKRLRAERN